jgi:hypothetical protein
MANKAISLGSNTRINSNNIESRLNDIECTLKKLELNLKLVDSEDIETDEFSNLKHEISVKCKHDSKNTKEFLTNMETKRYDNRLKKIVNYLSFICPVLTIINQTSIPTIINTEFAPEVIKSSLNNFQLYVEVVSKNFQEVLNGTTNTIDILDKALETDLFSIPYNFENKMSSLKSSISNKGSSLKTGVSTLANKIATLPGNLTTKLPDIINYVAQLCSSLNIRGVGNSVSKTLLKKYNLLYFTFCLSMFYVMLYSKIRLRVDEKSNIFNILNTTNTTNLLMQGSGKKGKKVKKSIGTKSKKKV